MAKKNKEKHGGRRVLIVILCILLVLGGAGYYLMHSTLGRMHRVRLSDIIYTSVEDETFETDDPEAEKATDHVDPASVTWDQIEVLDDSEVFNLLLIGQDRREGETRARSDSMILVSVNTKAKTIKLASFLRDLYVQIPGYSDNRINAAYLWGGMKLLDETIERNFGLHVDGNVEVDFAQFETIVDILGGVDVEMTEAEARYLQYEMHAGEMQTGVNHLNGEQALLYARMRKLDNDFGRTGRQRNLIASVVASLRSATPGQIIDLVNQVLPHITTDMSETQILSQATRAAQVYIGGGQLESLRIPMDGAYQFANIRDMSVLLPNLSKCQELLKEELYPDN